MDLTSPKTVRDIASRFGFEFSKGLGQNFLLDRGVLEDIVEVAQIDEGVLEIGPGFGVLTKELCKTGAKVVTVEVDKRLLPVLDYTVGEYENLKVVNADIMKTDLSELIKSEFGGKKISVAANLPYYITTPIITMLLEGGYPISRIVVMVQKEVAERLSALPGSKEYGAISVLCAYYTRPRIVVKVPAGSFYPPPKVDSAVLELEICEKPNVEVSNEELFFKVVKAAFSQRRKMLINCLCSGFGIDKQTAIDVLEKSGISSTIRGEKLGLSEFARITEELVDRGIGK